MLQKMNSDLNKNRTEESLSDFNDEEKTKKSSLEKNKQSSILKLNYLSSEDLKSKNIMTEHNEKKRKRKIGSIGNNLPIPKV